ncbi:hypothetical protein VE01_10350 [Pseudogymnoascus verrucosus]|uniref:Uncharacterized protein n=1 Tax=Pseudogymnoascus verrucosus TaxID=342668 RepID=A0A1B8G749_9PEZI|nr:uncharacterized protein VE01_10350 [Pseudogymnoascus verrucosus]OBT91658.2 hypothetical protein VE01_10350 [Pseudogymnoascus verrucosus]
MLKLAHFILVLAGGTLSTALPAINLFSGAGNANSDVCKQDFGPWDHSWTTTSCTVDEVVNTGGKYSARERWMAANATQAFLGAQWCWLFSRSTNHFSFSQSVSNYLHGPDGMKCEILDASGGSLSGCSGDHGCDEAGHAAGFQILNSMSTLHKLHQSTYDSLGKAKDSIIARVGVFSSVFSPSIDELKDFKIFLDIIGMGFVLAVAPLWNSAFKTVLFAGKPNALGISKDSVNGMVSNGISLGKDTASQPHSALGTQNTLSDKISRMIDAWMGLVKDTNTVMFSGTNDQGGLKLLTDIIGEGNLLEDSYQVIVDAAMAIPIMETVIWAFMIPMAWAMSNKDVHPFLMIYDDKKEKVRCDSPPPEGFFTSNKKVVVCVDGKAYWLSNASGKAQSCVQDYQHVRFCSNNKFSTPPGIDQLAADGKNNPWGGLSVVDIVVSSVASYKANGDKNGFELDPSNGPAVSDLASNGKQAAGVFTLPICSEKEASSNWAQATSDRPSVRIDKTARNYPCNQ